MSKVALTDAIQDYLKEIYKLQADNAPASVTALARKQGVSPASASAMVKKLAALGLADHQPYGGRGRPPRARDLRGARGADRPRPRLPDARPARRPDPGCRAPLAAQSRRLKSVS